LLITAGASVFRLLPPLVVEKEMIEKVIDFLDGALGELAA
jgi:4-aminobutyrate aminotransferase-like enzyme